MNIKIRKKNADGIVRVESRGNIKEVIINEDFLNPKAETISVCFKGINSSGIIDFTPKELENLYKSVKKRLHLIKSSKIIR